MVLGAIVWNIDEKIKCKLTAIGPRRCYVMNSTQIDAASNLPGTPTQTLTTTLTTIAIHAILVTI